MAARTQPADIKQRTFEFALSIVQLCRTLVDRSTVNRILTTQLLRSATSIGANVEEAQAGQTRADFVSKYSISLKEARETLYWLRLLDAADQLTNEDLKKLQCEADEIARIIGSIIINAKRSNIARP